jgi:tetratricopeptide (TPR) repeat protein
VVVRTRGTHRWLRACSSKRGNLTWAIASRGQTFRLMERYEEALADFNRAIELDPGDDDYIMKRAEIQRHIGPAEPTVLQTAPSYEAAK